jgi:hypothetical protein
LIHYFRHYAFFTPLIDTFADITLPAITPLLITTLDFDFAGFAIAECQPFSCARCRGCLQPPFSLRFSPAALSLSFRHFRHARYVSLCQRRLRLIIEPYFLRFFS